MYLLFNNQCLIKAEFVRTKKSCNGHLKFELFSKKEVNKKQEKLIIN